jgi:hypothetical protein
MKRIRFFIIIISLTNFLLWICCNEEVIGFKKDLIGNWQLYEIRNGNDDNWIKTDSVIKIMSIYPDGKYTLSNDGNIKCEGYYEIKSDSTIRFNPDNCMPFIASTEVIKNLTQDTLIISFTSLSISSSWMIEKYFRIK